MGPRTISLTVLVFFIQSFAVADLSERTSLGLEGCAVVSADINSDASLVLLGCSGPHGLYYSLNFGDTWIFAEGGDYSAGSASDLAITANGAYASISSKLYKSSLPTDSNSWTPDWQEVEGIEDMSNPYLYKSTDRYLIISNIGTSIKVFDSQTDEIVQTFATPDDQSGANLAIGTDHVYLIIRVGQTASLYRADFNPSTATLSGTWEDISAQLPAASNFWNLFYAGDSDKLYVGVRTAGEEVVDNLYVSENNGDSFTQTSVSSVPNSACFADDVYIIGTRISLNDGLSWSILSDPETEGDVRFEDTACLIDPQDSNRAMVATNRGLAKTSNLLSGVDSTWTEAVSGLEAVVVYSLSQSQQNADRVLLGTSGGLAFTDDFTSDSPSWVFPICPGNDCVGGRNVLIDPLDDSIAYYGSGNIRKGTIDTSGDALSISWEDFSPTPGNLWFLSAMRSYSFIPDKLFCSYWRVEGETNGGVYWYDKSDGTEHHSTDSDVDGKPISAFIALSENVMFASVAGFSDNPTAESRALVKSTDGGLTWEEITDEAFSDTIYVYDFAYDEENDILYAASQQDPFEEGVPAEQVSGTVYSLSSALTGTGAWQRPENNFPDQNGGTQGTYSFTSVEVDPYTGYVYASAQNMLWRSLDNGLTWALFYVGLDSETTSVLHFDVSPETEGSVHIQSDISRLTQGANTGIYELSLNVSQNNSIASPLYMPWNGFLSMVNILELVNKGQQVLPISVTMYDNDGNGAQPLNINIPASGQYDLVLNDLENFSIDSYGIVKIEWEGNDLDGRLAFYRANQTASSSGDAYDFAFMLSFENPITGESNLAFNTYNPSTNLSDSDNLVVNWLSIINLDAQNEKVWTVKRYNQEGVEIFTSEVRVPPLGRMDVDGGHESGANIVGFNKITPVDPSASYLAFIVRYGLNDNNGFDFAFPLLASRSEETTQWAPVSSGAGGVNWIELVNVSGAQETVVLDVFDNQGNDLFSGGLEITLAPYKQQHVNASALLSAGNSGAARIVYSNANAIMAQSMFYFLDSSGSIDTAYGKQFVGAASGTFTGSWNLFLGMYNWLRIYNTTDSSQSVLLNVYNNGETMTTSIPLAAKNGIDLGLHEINTYDTSLDSYGQLSVAGSGLITEVLRLRPNSLTGIDFAAPTKMRP